MHVFVLMLVRWVRISGRPAMALWKETWEAGALRKRQAIATDPLVRPLLRLQDETHVVAQQEQGVRHWRYLPTEQAQLETNHCWLEATRVPLPLDAGACAIG